MAKVSEKAARENARVKYMDMLMEYFYGNEEDILQVKSNEFCFPIVDELGNEQFLRVTVSVPTGTKDEPYDGYELAKEYERKVVSDKAKAAAKEAEKQAKIARDEARRAKVAAIHEKGEA